MSRKYKGIMPAFIHPPQGVSQIFMTAMHNSYRAGVFQHDYVAELGSRPNMGRTRNGLHFLQSDAEWIFLVDTDMAWEPEAIITLKQFAEKHDKKMISGWALILKNGVWPNAYRHDGIGYVPWGEIEPFSLPLKVDAVGGSCVLIHRDIYEKVAERTQDYTQWLWQDDEYVAELGYQMGEDITFCDRVRRYTGEEIWYHPNAIFTHIKPTPYGPKEYLRFISGLRERINANLHSADIQSTSG